MFIVYDKVLSSQASCCHATTQSRPGEVSRRILPGMNAARMNAVLAEMTLEEIGEVLWYVEVFEKAGMSRQEADEWKRRIVAWQRFLALDLHSATPSS